MKKINHSLFSLDIPNFFDTIEEKPIVLLAESTSEPYRFQKKRIKIYLERLEDLESDTNAGDTLEEKWEDYCLFYFKSEKIYREEDTFNGHQVWKMHAKTDAKFQHDHYKIRYFFAAIFLDQTFVLQFEAMYESDAPWELEDWISKVYESLLVNGGEAERHAAFRLHLVEAEELEMQYKKQEEERVQKQEEAKRTKTNAIVIPVDGKDYFKIGGFDFEFVQQETHWQIGDFAKDLQVTLRAKTRDFTKAVKRQLLDDYEPDGTVSLIIPAKGIHYNGIPTGNIRFKEEKTNAPLFLHARSKGFDYRLAFNGAVTFKEGWVLLSGEMTKDYHNKSFPVKIAKKFDIEALNWKDYRFTSMEETATAKPENVRFLFLQNPKFTSLPEMIFGFKNLEDLNISKRAAYWDNEKLPLNEVQEEIGELGKLKSLHITGAAIKNLPNSVSSLSNLEQLSVVGCFLEALPKGIFKLPKLKYLWASNNRLTGIPEEIDLPSLENIGLKGNGFTSLPAILGEQPKLNKMDLQDNPWQSLPENFNAINTVELCMEDKLRLLDFNYKGADGRGLMAWNEASFYAENDTELLPQIDNVINKNALLDKSGALRSLVKKAIGFTHIGEEDYREVGNHRFGGMPDLPKNIPYPKFGKNRSDKKDGYAYEFLGQINCGEIAHLQSYLPRTGILFFFLETVHNVYGESNNPAKVIYGEDISNLSSGKRFQFAKDDYFEMFDSAYTAYKVKADKINSVPSFYASYLNKHLFLGKAESLKDDEKLMDSLQDSFEGPINEANTFEYAVNAHGFTQHENPELQASLKKKGNPQDWTTLLVLSSAGDMQWGDAGDLFFVIHKSDLAKGDFNNVFVTLESS